MKKTLIISALLLFVLVFSVYGQYYGERVLEKSFEQTEFFFTPSYLNPFGIRGFNTVSAGLINDVLLNLQINPANLSMNSDTPNYIYIDFRSVRNTVDRNYYPYPYYGDIRTLDDGSRISMPYPMFYARTRKQLEPLFSAAFVTRPLKTSLHNLFVGATYQMILQDDKYYSIPQDIYKSNFGYDYAGIRVTESADIPVIDKYSGKDDMHHIGHFVGVHTGYEINNDLQVGLRISRANFERDGSLGSKNLYEYSYSPNYSSSSTWYNMESRNQTYGHWDISGGIKTKVSEELKASAMGGFLWGDANQSFNRLDTSNYLWGTPHSANNWSISRRFATTEQAWNHHGKTYYGGVNLTLQNNPTQIFNFYYNYRKQNIDISLGSSILDTSFYASRYQWDTIVYIYNSQYGLVDTRNGAGEKIGTHHRFMATMQWKIESNIDLNIGFSVETQKNRTKTDEAVIAAYRSSYNSSGGYYPYSYLDAGTEDKNLKWDFNTELTILQIPVIVNWRLNEKIELILGLNRQISTWEIDDVTLAIFEYREKTSNTGTTIKRNFGERYTQPKEKLSDIRTTFLGGITFAPSKLFSARLLFTPTELELPDGTSKSDFQWWIGLNLYP